MFDHEHSDDKQFVNPIEGISWEYSIDNYSSFNQYKNSTFFTEI